LPLHVSSSTEVCCDAIRALCLCSPCDVDGVSEGQFKQVLENEVQSLKGKLVILEIHGQNLTTCLDACAELKINPKITVIIVAKRHHVRFFPTGSGPNEQDKSGNCLAGTVVDQVVAHPTEFDFYLQSHGGLLGTSRPAHYNVLFDENGFR